MIFAIVTILQEPNSALQHLNDLVMVNENQKDPKKVMSQVQPYF